MTSSVNMYWLSASAQAAYADLAGADSKSEKKRKGDRFI